MRGASNNPNPFRIVTGTTEQLNEERKKASEDYRFYARVLRVIYNKPKLRNMVMKIMEDIDNIRYFKIPDRK
jgi:hypothetical protein